MALEKIYIELMELYNSSGKEFFSEVTALLENYFPAMEHTILGRNEEGDWRLCSSTIRNSDETDFLKKVAEMECKECGKENFCFSKVRNGVKSHIVIPLTIRKRKTVGVWILESLSRERLNLEREIVRIGKFLALFLQMSVDERLCVVNRYLDAGTNLPGRLYFMQVAARISKHGRPVLLCCFRLDKYREGIRMRGAEMMESEMQKLTKKIIGLELGNVYSISEDTLVVITPESRQEVYARLEEVLEEAQTAKQVKTAMFALEAEKDILTEIEEIFSECTTGITWVEMQKKEGPLGALFGEERNLEEEMNGAEDGGEDFALGLLGLLGKEDRE